MSWLLLIVVPAIVVWVASLHIIITASRFRSKAFPSAGDKKQVLLVVAHPDDESMFFSPSINYLTSRGHNVYILCMSTGNADGMGSIRKDELYQACAVLKVPPEQVKALDHVEFQDGFGKLWNHKLLAKIVEEEVVTRGINLIITFDSFGVSGHRNHRDVHRGICNYLNEASERKIEAWELISLLAFPYLFLSFLCFHSSDILSYEISTNILRKYGGTLDVWSSIFSLRLYPRRQVHCLLNENPKKSFLAMSQHSSQWVWFRKLFVIFSSNTYVNTLKRINM